MEPSYPSLLELDNHIRINHPMNLFGNMVEVSEGSDGEPGSMTDNLLNNLHKRRDEEPAQPIFGKSLTVDSDEVVFGRPLVANPDPVFGKAFMREAEPIFGKSLPEADTAPVFGKPLPTGQFRNNRKKIKISLK